ncbi:MAG: dihydroorotase [Firmicutes bacterium]|nr:dihydroorotase [Bacillota bacterium]
MMYKRKDGLRKDCAIIMKDNRYRKIEEIDIALREGIPSPGVSDFDFNSCFVFPGFTDVHVHLREPGFLFKETIGTGSEAAAAGGFTNIVTMPNLNPCPDSIENLQVQTEAIKEKGIVNIFPAGAISKGEKGEELADIRELSEHVIGFSDDGRGVMSENLMREAMITAKALNKPIIAHCEDENFPRESSEAEYMQLKRDLDLVRETGCRYHLCHMSTKESVELIREAKSEGLPVTCETAPHYLVLDSELIKDEILREDGGRFKMNPPIKEPEDRRALIEAIKDGTIDMIATDHAPHTAEEKSKGFRDSAFGIVGLETAFPILYTELVLKEIISLDELVDLMSVKPAEIFGIGTGAGTSEEAIASGEYTIWDLDEEYEVNPDEFLTMGRSTPFEGRTVKGRNIMTVIDSKPVWRRQSLDCKMTITENTGISEGFYKLTLRGNHGITKAGQFINIKVPEHYLRRPLSVCDFTKEEVTVIYKVVGSGTEKLAKMTEGEKLDVLSPLGNGFTVTGKKPLLIGGAAGAATMYGLCRKYVEAGIRPTVVAGFRTGNQVFYVDEFAALGAELHIATEDGSQGTKGFVTDVLRNLRTDEFDMFCACGPEMMLKVIDEVMPEGADGQLSFEERMGCGFGACMGCSCETKYGNKRICKEGPVMDRREIIW